MELTFRAAQSTTSTEASIEQVRRAVCETFDVTHNQLMSVSRERRFARPRQVGMFLARECLGLSLARIAREFGREDHTTVLYGVRKVRHLIGVDAALRVAVEGLVSRFVRPHA